MTTQKLAVEIWSDITCPFCYIGKRSFETALEKSGLHDQVQVSWKSFELDPESQPDANQSLLERLAQKYGNTIEWAERMTGQVSARALQFGLKIDFKSVRPANTHDAHRLLHFAGTTGQTDKMKERLFSAHFIEGRDVGDPATLAELATEMGLESDRVSKMLASPEREFSAEVRQDEKEAQSLGVRGVPFFLLDRKYAISGAQDPEVFVAALQKALEERE